MNTPQITTYYADGRPSETRDMTDEEIAELEPIPDQADEPTAP